MLKSVFEEEIRQILCSKEDNSSLETYIKATNLEPPIKCFVDTNKYISVRVVKITPLSKMNSTSSQATNLNNQKYVPYNALQRGMANNNMVVATGRPRNQQQL